MIRNLLLICFNHVLPSHYRIVTIFGCVHRDPLVPSRYLKDGGKRWGTLKNG